MLSLLGRVYSLGVFAYVYHFRRICMLLKSDHYLRHVGSFVYLSVRVYQFDSHWTDFSEIQYWRFSLKPVVELNFFL